MPRSPRFVLPQPIFDEPVFAEGKPTPDPTRFRVPHPSDAEQYSKIESPLYQDAVPFPPARGEPADLYSLATALGPHGPEVLDEIRASEHLVFHLVGDIGASTAAKYPGEIRVSDAITHDVQQATAADRPAFLYLLGDVIYDFGEAQYYYDQFYEPYRNYPAPIFAIPGNHDSFVLPGTPAGGEPLTTFLRNFCSTQPVVTAEAGSLHRTAMTEPGVYFALDAPYCRILGIFSNALEDPGVISSQGGTWKAIPDLQLGFLAAQLGRVKSDAFTGALLLAVHHPPFSYAPPPTGSGAGGPHGGSPAMLAQIDALCEAAGVYPHAIVAGHAHNYQRFTRSVRLGNAAYEVPFVVSGDGGHNVSSIVEAHLGSDAQEPADGADVSYLDGALDSLSTGLVLERHDDQDYGFLKVRADPSQLRIDFFRVEGSTDGVLADSVVVDLASHRLVAAGPPVGPNRLPSAQPRRGSRGRRPASRPVTGVASRPTGRRRR